MIEIWSMKEESRMKKSIMRCEMVMMTRFFTWSLHHNFLFDDHDLWDQEKGKRRSKTTKADEEGRHSRQRTRRSPSYLSSPESHFDDSWTSWQRKKGLKDSQVFLIKRSSIILSLFFSRFEQKKTKQLLKAKKLENAARKWWCSKTAAKHYLMISQFSYSFDSIVSLVLQAGFPESTPRDSLSLQETNQ